MNKLQLRKLFILLIVVYTICVSSIILLSYLYQRNAAFDKMETQLEYGARLVKYVLPTDYFDRAISPDAISGEEYQYYTRVLTEVAIQGNYKYIYALKNVGGKYYFIASSLSAEDVEKDRYDPYWIYYNKVPDLLTNTFRSQKPEFGKCTDEWGSFYSCFIAMNTLDGNEYIVGADYDIAQLNTVMRNILFIHLAILVALLLVIIPVYNILNKMQILYLHESETLREILYSTPLCVVVVDVTGLVRFANLSCLKVIGVKNDDIHKIDIFDPRLQNFPLLERLATCINNRETFSGDFSQVDESGKKHWKYAEISSIYYRPTNSLLFYAFSQDITGMKDSQLRLQQNNIVLNYLTQASHMLLSNPDPTQVIPEIIENLGNCLNRCMVQVVQKIGADWQIIASWKKHQINVSIKTTDGCDSSQHLIEDWESRLAQGTVLSAKTHQFPREFLNIIEVYVDRDFTIFPIIMKGQLWGFLTAVSNELEAVLNPEVTINSFSALADSIGAAIERSDIEKALRFATDAKSSFLSSISHEIRTPLNGILGMLTLMGRTKLDAEQGDYLDAMRSSGSQLQSLIGDVLDISRIEAGKFTLHKIPTNIRGTVFAVQQIVQFQIKEKNLDLVVSIDPMIPDIIIADEVRIKQILVNLLGNAIKFTTGGKITLSLAFVDESTLCLEVADTGIGMTPEQTEQIFEPFFQAGSIENKSKGTGLGLLITSRLVKLMGGDISVSSVLGQGTTFTCKFRISSIKDKSE